MEPNDTDIAALTLDQASILARIAADLGIRAAQAAAVVEMTAEGSTVPFISRYRKERTGNLDEVQVRDVVHAHTALVNLETRRIEVIQAIHGQGKLTADLLANIGKCRTMTELEDLYAPFKRKKKTRGMAAIERGLEPLADLMTEADDETVRARAADFVRIDAEHPELSVASPDEALAGAMDIVAERVSQDPDNRAVVKVLYLGTGRLTAKGVGDERKMEASTYKMYWDYAEPLSTLKPHRVMALNRGEREGELSVELVVDEDAACERLRGRYRVANRYHADAIDDSLRRLVSPAVLREIRSEATERADDHGIAVFSENLRNLLLSPPLKGTRVLGIDPGIRTGTKCAAMDERGKFLGYFVINQETKPEEAKKAIARAVVEYSLELIAVGNGTASHDVARVVAETIAENRLSVKYTLVDEDGASVYSASDIAREEFPELDLTIRGAISIGRRLQDPLAELVKIDPKSIGVGLYQHDVNQRKLSDTLDEVVESVVNKVGVNLNTASGSLLKYVSGINSSLARKIVRFRDDTGTILSRSRLMDVPGMGDKTFEQCAGFLKIPESVDPLDNTWVHPENYALARELLPVVRSGDAIVKELRDRLKAAYGVGDATMDDIVAELKKPNRDPRDDYPKPVLQQGLLSFEDLSEGMTVKGKVKNVVDFGAFVDIGIKESALIHVSQLSDRFVQDPMDAIKVGDVREFRILSLDPIRRRIGLTLRTADGAEPARKAVAIRKAPVPAGSTEAPGRPASTHGSQSTPRGPRQPAKEDDGTTYNPFAELLKAGKR